MSHFKTIDLSRHYNESRTSKLLTWNVSSPEIWNEMPNGKAEFQGVPFKLASGASRSNRFVAIGKGIEPVSVSLSGKARYVCILHFCDSMKGARKRVKDGDVLAEYTLELAGGKQVTTEIRKRFQVDCFGEGRGRACFEAAPYVGLVPLDGSESLPFGATQMGFKRESQTRFQADIWAFEVPPGGEMPTAITFRWRGGLAVGILGVTLYSGPGHPLRLERRNVFSVKLPSPERSTKEKIEATVDLGDVTAVSTAPRRPGSRWSADPSAGLGVKPDSREKPELLIEAATALGATMKIKSGKHPPHRFSMEEVYAKGTARSSDGVAQIRVLHGQRSWVRVRVVDDSTGKVTPTRIHFEGSVGEYLPPYGHHSDVNTKWFEDYAGEVKLGDTSYAYVPGEFQIELPEGDVYVECSKGFEYEPQRRKVTIKRGQKELELHIARSINLRENRWVTADTHVHFISPQTAWLEGQAEGLNLVNLLASQWGRLFTNVADITGKPGGTSADDTIVWVGTENRHHMLGHISMLGAEGLPVFPMCFGGPNEGYFGDPEYNLLTEWAESCRARKGAVIRPHFPGPVGEDPTYLIAGLADAVEIRSAGHPGKGPYSSASLAEWYRYLNCGYRVTAAGGTDKMSAATPVGGSRTYARLAANRPFSFKTWTEAVRSGRTFVSNGPTIDLTLGGKTIGDEILMPKGGGTLEAVITADSVWPVHVIELIVNGEVVDSTHSRSGAKHLSLKSKVKVNGTSWVAARCASTYERHQIMMGAGYLGAHTSPIYVKVPDSELFSPSDAVYMLTLLEGTLAYLDTLGTRLSDKRHVQMMAIVQNAQHELMHRMGMNHGHP